MWFMMNFAALSGHKMAAGRENVTVIFAFCSKLYGIQKKNCAFWDFSKREAFPV